MLVTEKISGIRYVYDCFDSLNTFENVNPYHFDEITEKTNNFY